MAASRLKPVFTENFSSNLADIQAFLGAEGKSAFDRLFRHLVDDVVPLLCRFPRSGRSFLERSVHSNEALAAAQKLSERLEHADDLRELIAEEYLVVYLVRGRQVAFLSIRHHRQLTFDLKRFWRE